MRIRARYELLGTHMHVRVFINGGLSGTLVMSEAEMRQLQHTTTVAWEWIDDAPATASPMASDAAAVDVAAAGETGTDGDGTARS